MRPAKVAHHIALDITPLLRTDNHNRLPIQFGKSANHRLIIAETAVTVQFNEICEYPFNVIQSVRTLRMTRQLYTLPRRKIGENRTYRFIQTVPEHIKLRRHINIGSSGELFPFRYLLL